MAVASVVGRHHRSFWSLAEEASSMSAVVTFGVVILILAFLAMFLFTRWQLRTIAFVMAGGAIVYVGVVAWYSNALDSALKRRSGHQPVDSVPHKVVESGNSQVQTNNSLGVSRTNAP